MNEFSGAPYSAQAILTVDVSDEAIESARAQHGKKARRSRSPFAPELILAR